jgi:hypothetical protein
MFLMFYVSFPGPSIIIHLYDDSDVIICDLEQSKSIKSSVTVDKSRNICQNLV